MKDENAFNASLSKRLKRLEKKPNFTLYIKPADKFREGISDFLIFRSGKTLALETKFVGDWPSDKALLLKHEFSGAQQTFLESMVLSGNLAFGLVAVDSEKKMFLIPQHGIPESGNWNTGYFKENMGVMFRYDGLESMIEMLMS